MVFRIGRHGVTYTALAGVIPRAEKKGILMIIDLLYALAVSLVSTVALELVFFFLVCRRNKKDILLVLLVNILTNPVVVLSFWLAGMYTNLHDVIIIIPLELFAVLCEGYYYKKYGRDFKRPFLFSAAANAFSFGTGLILQLLQII